MKLSEDGIYMGFIKVYLKFWWFVMVFVGIWFQFIYDVIKEVNLVVIMDKWIFFYLFLDVIKQLYISSIIIVSEVIQGLFKKFMVVDNFQKFVFFKWIYKDG